MIFFYCNYKYLYAREFQVLSGFSSRAYRVNKLFFHIHISILKPPVLPFCNPVCNTEGQQVFNHFLQFMLMLIRYFYFNCHSPLPFIAPAQILFVAVDLVTLRVLLHDQISFVLLPSGSDVGASFPEGQQTCTCNTSAAPPIVQLVYVKLFSLSLSMI